ncbi:MAG: mRNA surveillance protein pelota [Methanophagales archaeon]|nr:mRNA surveillance protein pelota [Methanophagales archaeon]
MRILEQRLFTKKEDEGCEKRGEVTLIPETLDDLWHLKHLIGRDDIITALTYRKIERDTGKVRPERAEKKPVNLSIRVESVEFQKFSRRLRIKGVIEAGLENEKGSHHTINVGTQTKISILKECWKSHHLRRLFESRKMHTPAVLLTIEEGEAVAGILREYGVDEIFAVRGSSGKIAGRGEEARREFFGEILRQLKNALSDDAKAVIVAGPGFVKDEFFAFLRERAPEIARIATKENTASIGTSGFLELLRRGAVERVLRAERLATEARMFEKLLEEISKDSGKAAYGFDEVERCVQFGAVQTLLVSDNMLTAEEDEAVREKVERIMREVEQMGGEVLILSTEFEPGKRLKRLGGVAALLRFKVA